MGYILITPFVDILLIDIKNELLYKKKQFYIVIYVIQAKQFCPSIFMAHEPQIPSRHDRLNDRVASSVFFIVNSASKYIWPYILQWLKQI